MKQGFLTTIRVLFVVYMIAVCCLCFLNLSFTRELEIPKFIWGIPIDKVVHFVMFLPYPILAIPVFNLSRRSTGLRFWRCLLIFCTGIVFAAATELIQKYLILAREGDLLDFKADILGLASGLVLFFIFCPPIIKSMRESSLY